MDTHEQTSFDDMISGSLESDSAASTPFSSTPNEELLEKLVASAPKKNFRFGFGMRMFTAAAVIVAGLFLYKVFAPEEKSFVPPPEETIAPQGAVNDETAKPLVVPPTHSEDGQSEYTIPKLPSTARTHEQAAPAGTVPPVQKTNQAGEQDLDRGLGNPPVFHVPTKVTINRKDSMKKAK
jgi:hypothetical protein